MRDIVFLCCMVATLPWAFAHAYIGSLLWTWTALLTPSTYLYSFMGGVPLNKLAAGITVLALLLNRQGAVIRLGSTAYMLIGLVLLGGVSMMSGGVVPDAGWEIYDRLVKTVLLFLVLTALINTRLRLHMLLLIIALSIGYNGLNEGLKVIVSGGAYKPEVPLLGDNNHFAGAILMVIPVIGYLYRYSEEKCVKLALFGTLLLCTVSVIGTYSRGGFIGLLVITFSYIMTTRRKIANLVALAALAGLLLLITPDSWFERMNTIQDAGEDSSFMGRVVAWKISTLIALDHPLAGGGFRAVQTGYFWHMYSQKFHLLDFIPTPEPLSRAMAAHSIFFEVLGDLGFTGLFLFVGVIVTVVRSLSRVRGLTRGQPELAWAFHLAGALRLSVLVYTVTGAALSLAYFEFFYVLCAAAASLRCIVEGQPVTARSPGKPLAAAPART
ncbi:putative O-glycosylation ligase, exosortase A system-associated [Azospirillum canadense]|uniref:putative O-glycosylation ligase, exosortase A system-associated n=1 Tax=Azospirillum canadense TaxID=403962 RepID=UPI002225EF84|nr:putative O-glycosylation ligase, exosortase A system-associated [Azospirillum canadense]MCW2240910.1 putative O-glycosylation ligase (exosortase A-associated) [Azospirillum canadense]